MHMESNLHCMNLHGLLINGRIDHKSKICEFILQGILVISSIIDDTASDKTNEENHLQRRELFVLGITPPMNMVEKSCFHGFVNLEVEKAVKTDLWISIS